MLSLHSSISPLARVVLRRYTILVFYLHCCIYCHLQSVSSDRSIISKVGYAADRGFPLADIAELQIILMKKMPAWLADPQCNVWHHVLKKPPYDFRLRWLKKDIAKRLIFPDSSSKWGRIDGGGWGNDFIYYSPLEHVESWLWWPGGGR